MTILVGFAPHKDDSSAIELGATLARSRGDDLLVVSVVPAPWPTPLPGGADKEFASWSRERGEAAVAEAEQLLAQHCPDLDTEATWVTGRSVPSTLWSRAREAKASLIALGSGNNGPWGQVVVSTTADWLLHTAEVPVAVGTRGYRADPDSRVSRVTCAFRGDDASRRVLRQTAHLCSDMGVPMRVVTFAVQGRSMHTAGVSGAEEMVADRWVEQVGAAQAHAVEGLTGVDPETVEQLVAAGRDWTSAFRRVDWIADEVLVVGSSVSSPVTRLFLGHAATKIVRQSPTPVIVVP
ncbi:universal stress protein [Ornithinicoccus hortensis]|uniref:Nucleotide-binding universal stress UspA family protein n=1 Tax=Ornithinicoccus hortensis TaxID=82346 RepID=A0A542YQN4_9MICO|nr:universal stress protein [Ornithinicoccus hortensis]TQL50410.1 nucleotide-binding universal stress UspA family protein [Ornithinicoccus hortensis]